MKCFVLFQTVEHCYYHGTIKRDDWSAAAVSTCNGIRWVVQYEQNDTIIMIGRILFRIFSLIYYNEL